MSSSIALPPPATIIAAPAGVSPASPPTATVLDGAAQALAALADGGTLSGTIAPGSANGAVTLLTVLGTVSIATDLPLPAGASVTLQAQATGPGSAVIVAVDGSTPANRPAASTVPPATPTPAAPVLVDLGRIVTATVVTPPNPPPEQPAGAAPAAPTPGVSTASAAPLPAANAPTPAAPATGGAAVPSTAALSLPETIGETSIPTPPLPSLGRTAPAISAAPSGVTSAAQPQSAASDLALRVPAVEPAPPAPVPGDTVGPGPKPAPTNVLRETAAPSTVPLVDTPAGPLPVRGASPLPAGTNLALRILAIQPPPPILGNTIDPRPVPALTGVVREAPPPGTATLVDTPAGPLQLRGAPSLPAGTRVALRLLPDAPAHAELTVLPDTTGPSVPPPGKSPAAPPTSTSVPAPEAVPIVQGAVAGDPVARPLTADTISSAAPPAPESDEAPAQFAPPATRVVLASPSSPNAAPSTQAGRLLTGTVLPEPSGGRAPLLVETPVGVLAVTPKLAAPPGSLLLLSAQNVAAPPAGIIDDRVARPEKIWASLSTALPALEHAAPTLAAQLRADLAPQAGGDRLAAIFLFLIDAMRNQDGPPWPGDIVAKALIATGHEDDQTRLVNDLGDARRLAAAPATGAWQVFMLPLVEGPMVQPVRLYLKRRDKSRRDDAGESARFVLEFELSRLGALQLDGFVRPQRFDLMLRTKAPLGAALESTVERIFHDRIAAAGIGGTIDFTTVAKFDIAPLDGLRQQVGLAV